MNCRGAKKLNQCPNLGIHKMATSESRPLTTFADILRIFIKKRFNWAGFSPSLRATKQDFTSYVLLSECFACRQ